MNNKQQSYKQLLQLWLRIISYMMIITYKNNMDRDGVLEVGDSILYTRVEKKYVQYIFTDATK